MSKAVLLLLLLAFSSCSLKYDENPSGTDSSPELEFKDADYKKYEDNKLSTQIQAQTLEQYKDSSTYAKNARFKTWNSGGDLLTEGYCALLGINGDTKIYTLFNEIFIDLAISKGKTFTLASFDELDADDIIVCPYSCGAISPLSEEERKKYEGLPVQEDTYHIKALKSMEKYLGKPVKAVISTEIGAGNTAKALYCAAMGDSAER